MSRTPASGLKKSVRMRSWWDGQPWAPYIFHQINHYLETGEVLPDLTFADKLKVAHDHLTRLAKLKGESVAVREFRGLAPHYLRGTAGAAKIRGAVAKAESIQEVEALFDQALQR